MSFKITANASIGVIRCNVKKNSSIKNQTFSIILFVLSLGQSTFQQNIIKASKGTPMKGLRPFAKLRINFTMML